jgi:hypothetical protein
MGIRILGDQPTCSECSTSALLYAGQVCLLHELMTSTITKAIISITANFFISDTVLIHHKNKLFKLKTIFVPK